MINLFQSLSLFFTLGTAAILLIFLARKPWLFFKPGIVAITVIHLVNQWSSALSAREIYFLLSRPWEYFLFVHLFPPVALLLCSVFLQKQTMLTFSRMKIQAPSNEFTFFISVLLIPIVLIIGWYLVKVPLNQTGLAVVFGTPDPVLFEQNRAASLRDLNNRPLQYAHALFSNTLAPLLCVLIFQKMQTFREWKKNPRLGIYIVLLICILLFANIDGSRGPAFFILASIGCAFFLQKISFRRVMILVPCFAFMFLLPALMTLFAFHDEPLSFKGFWLYYSNVVDRSLGRIINPGIFHFDYFQHHDFLGLAGLGNTAKLFYKETINSFYVVGGAYFPNDVVATTANTTFIIALYASFGALAFPLGVVLLLTLDSLLLIYPFLHSSLLLACIASCSIAAAKLSTTVFTSIFITYGFAVIPLLCLCLTWLTTRVHQWPFVLRVPRLFRVEEI